MLTNLRDWLFEHTRCKLGWHSHKTILKFDGGRLPRLCKYCRLILRYEGHDRRIYLHLED